MTSNERLRGHNAGFAAGLVLHIVRDGVLGIQSLPLNTTLDRNHAFKIEDCFAGDGDAITSVFAE